MSRTFASSGQADEALLGGHRRESMATAERSWPIGSTPRRAGASQGLPRTAGSLPATMAGDGPWQEVRVLHRNRGTHRPGSAVPFRLVL